MKLFKPPGCVRFVCTDIHPDVINLNDNLPFSMKLIPLEQSVINVAKPYIVIAGIWALAKKQLEMITVQSHRRPPPPSFTSTQETAACLLSWVLSLSQ